MPAAWKDEEVSARPAEDFRNLVVKRRDACVQFKDGQPARDRQRALEFYRGDNLPCYGDSGDGLSSVVSRDVMEAVESVMPPLIRPFVAGEEVVSFEPIEKGDADSVEQATMYVNHVFRRHNNVLSVVQTSLKDGLLFREGIAKTVVEECEEGTTETFSGLNASELSALNAEREITGDVAQDPTTGLYSATVAPKKAKHFKVHIIAPDEFLREERLASLKQATFLGHSKQITVADLIDLGVDAQLAKDLGSGRPETQERDSRHEGEDEPEFDKDDLARPVWVDECYIKTAIDGVMQWRKVLLGGSQSKILNGAEGEPVEGHPYSHWTPIPIPHKLTGQSYYDITADVQMNKTAIQREMNNAMYLANRPQRQVLDGQVNLDDLLKPTVDGVVRVKQMGAIEPLPSAGERIFGASAQMIEYMDTVREARTGVTRYNQGMDTNSLNKTATGMNIIASASQQRQELVARQYGEFLRDIFERILALISVHADPADVERLTGKPFVPWPSSYDTNVNVGLGTNNRDQLVGHLMALSQSFERIVQLQQGAEGPLVTWKNIYEVSKRLPEAMGLKGDFFTDPEPEDGAQQMLPLAPPEPDPAMLAEQERLRNEQQVKAAEMQLEWAKKQLEEGTKVEVAKIDAEKEIAVASMQQPANDIPPAPVEPAPPPNIEIHNYGRNGVVKTVTARDESGLIQQWREDEA